MTTSAEALLTIALSQRTQVERFQEHLHHAIELTDDPKLKLIFSHLGEEESERIEALNGIIATLQGQGSHSSPEERLDGTLTVASPSQDPGTCAPCQTTPQPDPSQGHFARRDQNVLTVGSILNSPQ